jgi:hypothetical protein
MATITINSNTYTTQIMPTTPVAPVSLEFQHTPLVASTINPFTGQEIAYQWVNSAGHPIGYNTTSPYGGYKEVSVSIAAMTSATAQAWVTFLQSLQGPVCAFCFPTSLCDLYLNELTLDGVASSTNQRYFRLKTTAVRWSVAPGGIYNGVVFDAKEVL